MSRKPIAIDHFSASQQLGFKMILHCWCGDVLDLNLPLKQRLSIRKWIQEHEQCELPMDGSPTYEKLAAGKQ